MMRTNPDLTQYFMQDTSRELEDVLESWYIKAIYGQAWVVIRVKDKLL
jgi:hypothetical protein